MIVVVQPLERHAIQVVHIQAQVGARTIVELVIFIDRAREAARTTDPAEQRTLPVRDRETRTRASAVPAPWFQP